MRVFSLRMRMLGAVVLLCVAASAQTSTDPSSPSTPDPNAQPQPTNPLQEPPKVTEAELTKPAQTKFEAPKTSLGEDQVLGEIKLMTRFTELNGDVARSFRVPDYNNLAEFNFFSDQRFLLTHRLQILSSFRTTDDRSIDPERVSLQRGFVRFFGPRDEFILGDSLVNYSRLSFNQNVKGMNGTIKLGDAWKVSAAGGIFIDRWGSLYKDMQGRPYMAAVAGGRLERTLFNRDSRFGLNFSNSRDQEGSLPAAVVGTSPLPVNNTVSSLDFKASTKSGIRWDSEFAYSLSDFDARQSLTCLAPCDTRVPQPTLNGNQGDWGARAEGSYRFRRMSLRGSFVRYQPAFASVNARQISDLQDMVFRVSYDLTNWLTVDGTARRSNNNLRDQLPFTTTLLGPEGRFTLHDLPFYRRAVFEFGYRHRDVSSSDVTSVSRFVRIPYAEFSLPFKSTFLTLGYERRQAIDALSAAQTSNTGRAYVALRGLYDIGHWSINPSFRYELERQGHRPELPLIDRLDYDNNRLGSASLFIEAPKWFIVEGAFRSSSATIFGPTGFSRPSYKTALTYKFRNDENMLMTFGFERNNNFYFTSNDYDERMWSGTILYRFGRRGQ